MGVPERNIYVVPNGVEARFEKGKKALFKNKFGTENFILNVGHIGPDRKNVLRLIQALETINHPAVIIGRIEKTPEGDRCLELAKRNPRLMILDSVAHDSELFVSAYAACDVFVLPSQFETPGIAALEAGLAGAKVVITPHGGTKEYFREYAEYVDPYSVENIRTAIQNALNRQKNTQLRDHIKENFLWKSVAQRLLALYQTVLEKKPQ
jgi:glycosyltransferase involved in cell wall biosynthesis